MSGLNAADRTRLAKLLGLLGSDLAGERDAAGLAAQRLMKQRGVTWRDVLEPPAVETQLPQLGVWRATVNRCLKYPDLLRPWELGFLLALPKFRRLSVKQRYVLNEIANRILGEQS